MDVRWYGRDLTYHTPSNQQAKVSGTGSIEGQLHGFDPLQSLDRGNVLVIEVIRVCLEWQTETVFCFCGDLSYEPSTNLAISFGDFLMTKLRSCYGSPQWTRTYILHFTLAGNDGRRFRECHYYSVKQALLVVIILLAIGHTRPQNRKSGDPAVVSRTLQ